MISIFKCGVKLYSSMSCTPRLNFNKAFSQKFIHFSCCEKYSHKDVAPIPMLASSRYQLSLEKKQVL